MLSKEDYINHVIPYRMRAVGQFNLVTRYLLKWKNKSKGLELYLDGELTIKGLSTAFTNPTIEAGVIHCRALLEFLGLGCSSKNPEKLSCKTTRRVNDYGIEHFVGINGPLKKLSIDEATSPYAGPDHIAEKALAGVVHTANTWS